MKFALALVIIILILSLVGTIALLGKSDENYKSSSKQNTIRLTLIYLVVILAALGGLTWYITNQ